MKTSMLALSVVATASVWSQCAMLPWLWQPPQAADLLAELSHRPQSTERLLQRLPSNPRGVTVLIGLLAAEDLRIARAARRSLLARLDELLTGSSPSRHDRLAVCMAAALSKIADDKHVPVGVTEDLVTRLLRFPPVDESMRAQVAEHCTRALQHSALERGRPTHSDAPHTSTRLKQMGLRGG